MGVNLSFKLPSLFRESLKKKNVKENESIDIYFYEWSNVNCTPLHYFRVDTFEHFLTRSGIKFEAYQHGIISRLGKVYISCYKGTKTLVIKSSYDALRTAMYEFESNINH